MNAQQMAAARSLRTALAKVRDADLSLRVYDGAVYVVPVEALGRYRHANDACLTEGEDIAVIGLNADGGAGA